MRRGRTHKGCERIVLIAVVLHCSIGIAHCTQRECHVLVHAVCSPTKACRVYGLIGLQGLDILQIVQKEDTLCFALRGINRSDVTCLQRKFGRDPVIVHKDWAFLLILQHKGHLSAGTLQLAKVQHGGTLGIGLQACKAVEIIPPIASCQKRSPARYAAAITLGQVEVLEHQGRERLGSRQASERNRDRHSFVVLGNVVLVRICSARYRQAKGHILIGWMDFVRCIPVGCCSVAFGTRRSALSSFIVQRGLHAHRSFGRHEGEGIFCHRCVQWLFVLASGERECHCRRQHCHPERSEGSRVHQAGVTEILRYALNDSMCIVLIHSHLSFFKLLLSCFVLIPSL